MSRHLRMPRLAAGLGTLLMGLSLGLASAHATGIKAQRRQFMKAYAAAQQGQDWRALAGGLQGYPLYPYLQAAELEHDIRQASRAQVEAYLKRYPHWIPARRLRHHFLQELARRKDWNDFLAMYRPGEGTELHCDALQARLAGGATLHWKHDLAALWKHASLPDSCDPVQQWAHQHGLLTSARLWERIDIAAKEGRAGTVASLTRWLPQTQSDEAQRLLLALRHPARAVKAASSWPRGHRDRRAAELALLQLSRSDSEGAASAWPKLHRHFRFSTAQRHHIESDIALFSAADFDPEARHRLRALPAAAQTPATRAWRVRLALAERDWPAVLHAIHAMPRSEREQNQWRYFKARALKATGHAKAAAAMYGQLAGESTYFGFLAADRAKAPYTICPAHLSLNRHDERALLKQPGLRRALELFAVDLLPQARREWDQFIDGRNADQRRLAADIAYRRGWYDRAIFMFSSGDAIRLYHYRFPLAPRDRVVRHAEKAGIDPAWAYAIIRAESAWMSDAQSGADARGLMQLLPVTAARVARHHHVGYDSGSDLYDPSINVTLGTYYLANLAQRFNGSPWLASAAYNAGPTQVDRWLDQRSQLPPDIFVATIPYHETREYVARVMAFSEIYDWRLHDDVVPMSTRMPDAGATYTPPTAATPRKPVVCPAQATVSAQAAGDKGKESTP